jgi:hypothetical protein
MLEFFAERAGRYPYARLTHVEAPVPAVVAGPAMVLHPEGSLAKDGPADSTVALATARQWFGVAISPATNEDRGLIDGLARSLAREWRARGAAPRSPAPGDSITTTDRSVLELRLLRANAGDAAFFAGLRAFAGERLHQSASRADFVRAMSAATGRDIERDLPETLGRGR